MNIRKAREEDLPEIHPIFEKAREYMRNSGNPNQWGSKNPDPRLIEEDIRLQRFYLVEENQEIVGAFAFIIGQDPTYQIIYDGQWLNDKPYGTIHRLASNGTQKGLFNYIIKWLAEQYPELDIRADTHHENRTMQHLFEKNQFQKCGIIYLLNGNPRIAYQRLS